MIPPIFMRLPLIIVRLPHDNFEVTFHLMFWHNWYTIHHLSLSSLYDLHTYCLFCRYIWKISFDSTYLTRSVLWYYIIKYIFVIVWYIKCIIHTDKSSSSKQINIQLITPHRIILCHLFDELNRNESWL